MGLMVTGITLPYESTPADALAAACRVVSIAQDNVNDWRIVRQSLDLRRGRINRVWTVGLELGASVEKRLLDSGRADLRPMPRDALPTPSGTEKLTGPPIVIGFGPAGLFAALVLAENGYRPHVLERGSAMEKRDAAVADFFAGGALDERSNIQFGEGGAGTYSDGKLTTRIGHAHCGIVLNQLARFGAPAQALSLGKPHIGTDLLKGIVTAMRQRIVALGGRVDFNTRVTGLDIAGGTLRGVETEAGPVGCQVAVMAIGHSARDTFDMLVKKGIDMAVKPFSVGVRIEHLQARIDAGLYGKHAGVPGLPPGEYTLANQLAGGRGCYSFCMCPGGQVVAAASEAGGVVTNGMSLHARDGVNANAALCVSVTAGDLPGGDVLAGVHFQRTLERAAFEMGGGRYQAPVQRLGDFLVGRASVRLGAVEPTYPRGHALCDLNRLLPGFVAEGIAGSMAAFARKIRGFDDPDAVLTGVETRTSSPVRIVRREDMWSAAARGLIPCGEGAGYAGGIMSAAVDGIRAAERIMAQYAPEF